MPLFGKIWVCGGLVGGVFVVCVCVVCGHIHIPTQTPQTHIHLGVGCMNSFWCHYFHQITLLCKYNHTRTHTQTHLHTISPFISSTTAGNGKIGIPVILLKDGEGGIITIETKLGETLRGYLFEAEGE